MVWVAPMNKRPRLLLVSMLAGGLSVSLTAANAAWLADGSGVASSAAATTNAGNSPTVTVTGRNADLSWSAATYSTGAAVSSYLITRYDSSGVSAQTMTAGSCLGTVTATSCTETAVPSGTWRYTVTPTNGNWRGAESAQVSAVVGLPTLTLTPTYTTTPVTLTGSVANFVVGQTLQFRLDNASTGALLTGTVAGSATPAAMPAGVSAAVTVALPVGTTSASHTVYAAASNGESAGASVTVDNTAPPAPTLTGNPGNPSSQSSATFSFTDTGAVASYQCKLDGGAYATCTSPTTYTGLADGSHTFSVTATNSLGTVSAPTTYTWTINSQPPSALVVFPASGQSYTSANYTAGCSTPAVGDICGTASAGTGTLTLVQVSVQRVATGLYWDGTSFASAAEVYFNASTSNAWANWTWGFGQAGFPADGSYTVHAKATNSVSVTGPVAGATFTLDNVAPVAPTFSSTPASLTRSTSGTFAFTDAEAGVIFQCQLDAGAYATCTSPTTLSSLSDGSHTFNVRAVDAAGNASPAASYTWTVDTVPPVAPALTATPPAQSNTASPSFSFTDAETPVTFACSLDGAAAVGCTSPKAYSGLADGAHIFSVTATDPAGNTSTAATYTWTIDTVAPTGAITFPVSGSSYNATSYNAGCGTAGVGDLCGTAADAASGVSTVRVSVQAGAGNYWNGSTFGSASEALLTPTGTTAWNYALATSALTTGVTYTVRLHVTDVAGNASTTVVSTFTYIAGCSVPGTVTVNSDGDSYVDSGAPSSNFGTATSLKIDSNPGKNKEVQMHFALPATPAGCTVTAAKVSMNVTAAPPGGHLLGVTNAASSWTELTVTYNTKPAITGSTASLTTVVGTMTFTVTTQVQAQYAGSNNGFVVQDVTSPQTNGPTNIASRETATPETLSVTFG
ncbi:MAG: hypothetical protein NVSMB13_12580 [Mycobacteriales bacterium]